MPTTPPRPIDATLSVTKAARLLGVHPNTVRAWSDAGRLRYYRINPRGDRRYRLGDLQRFLAAAAAGAPDGALPAAGNGARQRGAPLPPPVGTTAGRVEPFAGADPSPAPDPTVPPTELEILAELARLAPRSVGRERRSLDELLAAAARILHAGMGLALAAIWELDGNVLVPRGASGSSAGRLIPWQAEVGAAGAALRAATGAGAGSPEPVIEPAPPRPVIAGLGPELAVALRTGDGPWGVLLLAGPAVLDGRDLAAAAGQAIAALVEAVLAAERLTRHAHRSEALRRVASDLGSRLDLDEVVTGVVDHALVLFEADRGSVALRRPDGSMQAVASRGLSASWLAVGTEVTAGSLAAAALADGHPVAAIGFRDDPRGARLRAAVVQEGFDTIVIAPLVVGPDVLGLLSLQHDHRRPWSEEALETLDAFAGHASLAIRTAEHYGQMARWAAQLQSIQQLGVRLNRMTTVREVGMAIATELRQLIDYHNVRVYRLEGEDLLPVAMQGQVGSYVDETPEQLRVRVGEGITGWVAEHKVPQSLPDAAGDPRANTIPGTEDDLDESMLLAPMLFEDEVLGVLVLSKLGLNQFTDDDLRLLVIYASFAAQAMANADAAARLNEQSDAVERQGRSQRELLHITESILTTLDSRAVLEQIADGLERLVGYDNISIELYDRAARMLRPLTARGAHAEDYLQEWEIGEEGIATWVIDHNEPVRIIDQFDDPRVRHFESTGPQHGGLIVVPLLGREGVTGVLTVERLGEGSTFSLDEFELVKLFAAQVSIALQNAEVHHLVELRAATDGLTGLLNHSTFVERLTAAVARGERFSLLMIDLDDFKHVNDALGHQAGDRLLAEISRTVASAGRDTDQVFRYGGDEFTLLLVGADAAAALAVAERVRAAIEGVGGPGTPWHDEDVEISASFGVSTFPDDGTTAESVLLAADRACFVAKRSGKGHVKTAQEGLALAAEFSLSDPTPVDSVAAPAA